MKKKIKDINKKEEEIFYSIILESNQADNVLGLIKKNINLVIDFFSLKGGAIFLLENKNANLFLNFNLNPLFVKKFNRLHREQFIFKEIFRHKYPFVAEGKLKEEFLKEGINYCTVAIVPIFYVGKPIGFYMVADNRELNFAPRDIKLMGLIGKEIGSFIDQVISEVEIKKERQNFKSFFNSLQDIAIVTDADGYILELNIFALKKLKYEKGYFFQKKITAFLLIEGKNYPDDNILNLFNKGQSLFLSIRSKKGNVPVEMNIIKGIWDEKEAYFFTAKDLSKTKEAEKKLKENQDLYISLVSSIPNYVIICNRKNKIVYANNSANRALSYKKNSILGKNIVSIIDKKSQDIFEEKIKNGFFNKDANCEIDLAVKKGGVLTVIIDGVMVKYLGEEAFLLVMTDITNRKKMENLLLEKTCDLEASQKSLVNVLEDVEDEKNRTLVLARDLEKFRLAVENASDHIVITDSNGILLYANSGAEIITGFSHEEVKGMKCGSKSNWGGMMDNSFYKKLWQTIKTEKKSFSGEVINKRKDGSIYTALMNISPVLNEKNDVLFFVCIERDITKEKEIDKAKNEFVSLASHQLRTPLSIVNWYAEMLFNGDAGEMNSIQKDYLNEIMIGNKRMVELVGSLLSVSRIEMGTFTVNPKKSNIIELSEKVIDDFAITVKQKNIDLVFSYDRNLPLLNIDSKLFNIIIDNLISNAVKYTAVKGKVCFEIHKSKDGILFSVSDNGYGILKKDKNKIFTKFFRGENAREKEADGNGLGLYIIKSIVEESNGKIWFESRENKGSTFFVLFPFSGMKKREGVKELEK